MIMVGTSYIRKHGGKHVPKYLPFEFHQIKIQKSYINWPQQPLTEKVPNISEKSDF